MCLPPLTAPCEMICISRWDFFPWIQNDDSCSREGMAYKSYDVKDACMTDICYRLLPAVTSDNGCHSKKAKAAAHVTCLLLAACFQGHESQWTLVKNRHDSPMTISGIMLQKFFESADEFLPLEVGLKHRPQGLNGQTFCHRRGSKVPPFPHVT